MSLSRRRPSDDQPSSVEDRRRAAEREAARLRGEQYAEVIDLAAPWSPGAPLPHVVSDGQNAYVVCLAHDPDPAWDGTYTTGRSPDDREEVPILVLELGGCRELRVGGPNDEALQGHPLWGRGLVVYAAHEVHNSEWIASAIRVNSVHPYHSDAAFAGLHHYLFAFHDDMVEALAHSLEVTVRQGTLSSVLQEVMLEMTSGNNDD